MRVRYSSAFKKQYKKLSPKLRQQFKERLRLWLSDPVNPQLRVHPLQGQYLGHWSMNVTGDVRALYTIQSDDRITWVLIGTHSQLY